MIVQARKNDRRRIKIQYLILCGLAGFREDYQSFTSIHGY